MPTQSKTEKLYYRDAYQSKTKALIMDQKPSENGVWILPDCTVFYPGGGGQLADIGTINGHAVAEISLQDDMIWHRLVDGFSGNTGEEVQLQIDWNRRFYNMQQHTGQHLLSHVLFEKGFATISVHLGEDYTLVEVEGGFPEEQLLDEVEACANNLIRKAYPVIPRWINRDEINSLPLRKPAGDWKELRVVEIDKLDFSACGGTHVRNTAEIGMIKLGGVEKIRGHARIKAYIGQKADAYILMLHRIASQCKDQLKVDIVQLPERITAMQSEAAQLKRDREFYRRSHIERLVRSLTDTDKTQAFIFRRMQEGDWQDAQDIARAIANTHRRIGCILFENRFALVSPDEKKFDPRTFLSEYGKRLSLSGGGARGFVQGVASESNDEMICEALKECLAN